MPVTATTELADVAGLSFDASVEDELTALWDDVSDYGNYHIQHRESGTSTWTDDGTVPQSDTDYVITGLADGEKYDVRVRAETEHVTSAWLQLSEVTLLPAPTLNTPTMGETTADLTWADNADNEDAYNIYHAKEYDYGFGPDELLASLAANTTAYTDDTLSPNRTYRFTVEAETEHVTASDTVTADTSAVDVPQKPVGSTGWFVEIEHPPSGQVLRPNVIDDPQFRPEANNYPQVEIPVPRNERWSAEAFEDAPMEVWKDGVRQEVGELKTVEHREDRTILTGKGGVELETHVTAEYDSKPYHTAAEELVTNNTSYGANVDAPPAETKTNEQLRTADSESELTSTLIGSFPADKPAEVTSTGTVRLLQTCFTTEGENYTGSSGVSTFNRSDLSGGDSVQLLESGDSVTWQFTTEHDIPDGSFRLPYRLFTGDGQSGDPPEVEVLFNGTSLGTSNITATLSWFEPIKDGALSDPGAVPAGTHDVEIRVVTAGTDGRYIDVVAPMDNRYSYVLDNDNGGSGGYLDGPELYPDAEDVIFDDATPLAYSIAGGRLETTGWNDTSNNQSLGLSVDKGQTWTTASNTTAIETDFSELSSRLRPRVTLSRFGSRTTATPQTGFNAQEFDAYTLFADLDSTPLIANARYEGQLIDILRELAERSDSVFEYRRSGPTGSTESIEWTTPGQRQSDTTLDTVSYSVTKTTADVVERAIISGQAQTVQQESFVASSGSAVDLFQDNLLTAREQVKDPSDTSIVFERDIDYTMDYTDGTITATSDGALADGQTYEVTYEYKTRGEFAAEGVTDPKTVNRTISALPTDRACGQAARLLVEELQEPRYEAQVTIPPTKTGWSVVEDVDLDQIPTNNQTLHVNGIEHAPNQTIITLETRQSIQDVMSDIRNRIESVSQKV